jgi:peptidoglycan/xylan/chitin deacetylase (PgdA/CDA1 family)
MRILLLALLFAVPLLAEPFPWPNGTKGAVTLSYDDVFPSHYKLVAPLLHSNGLHGTFYIVVNSERFRNNVDVWREVAAMGHELGNHSLHHPCYRYTPDQHPWLREEFNLANYTPARWLGEMGVASFALELVDGRAERTFGYNCCDGYIGSGTNRVLLEELVPRLFPGARGMINHAPIDPRAPNYPNLGCRGADNTPFKELRKLIEAAVEEGKWIFFMFHDVGEDARPLKTDKREHARLVEYLAANTNRIWTAPAIEVVSYLRDQETGVRRQGK